MDFMAGKEDAVSTEIPLAVSASDIDMAWEVLKDNHRLTPLMLSRSLSEMTGKNVYLKYENKQRSGSYKFRGAFVKINSLSDAEKEKGVIAASTGNNALAVARAASMQSVKSIVVVPIGMALPRASIAQYYGAEVRYNGGSYGEANLEAERIAKDEGYTLIHPYDDEHIIAGQGTIGIELLQDLPEVDTVIVPIGGGALISGIALAVRAKNPDARIIGVQASGAPPQEVPSPDGQHMSIRRVTSIADDITIRMPGKLTMPIIRKEVDTVVTVDEDEIARAFVFLLERHKTVAEGAGAVPAAAILAGKVNDLGENVICLISGGNLDINMMGKVIRQGLMKAGRILQIRVQMEDRPGRLLDLLQSISEAGANIMEVTHRRDVPELPYGLVELNLTFETRNKEHAEQLLSLIVTAPGTDLVEAE
ncbi:MAG: threonine ammonia-lyase [Thermoplasmata archaeon]|nr:threonine ammonia-lyase [Thermoplasmata archaeon]